MQDAAGDWGLPPARSGALIAVAMSGGVDSSVSAALLKARGYRIAGLTMRLNDAAPQGRGCCAGRDIHDARRVAQALEIPHYVLDYRARFREAVMEDFAESYLKGETPLPCARCNERLKFQDLLSLARRIGASSLATGHYASRRPAPEGGYALHRAGESARDQSYFLFSTTRNQLDFICFPLGGQRKADIRALAQKLRLPVAEKPDSQDICFVPTGRYWEIVERMRPEATGRRGEIVHIDGRVLGMHEGIHRFTPGQRRGLGIAAGEPLYVLRLDARKRQVIVGPKEAMSLSRLQLKEVNWLGQGDFETRARNGLKLRVSLRSTQSPVTALVTACGEGKAEVEITADKAPVARGQACAFYDPCDNASRLLGGGWIEQVTPA